MKKDNKALNDLDQEFNLFDEPKPSLVEQAIPLVQEIEQLNFKMRNAVANAPDAEHSKFMHSQVPEVEPEDTDTIHPDYQGIPMVANIPFKDPINEADVFNRAIDVYKISPDINNQIKLVVLGEPKSQKRHRHVNMGKFTRQYDPSANDKGDFLSVVQKQAPEKPIDVPVRLYINFYFTRPKSHYKTGKNAHILKENIPYWHTSKPDTDNCFKFVTDALNKVFWRDDSLICDVTVQKQYSDQPRIEILIQTL